MDERWGIVRRWGWRLIRIVAVVGVAGGIVYWFILSPITVQHHEIVRGPIVAEVMGTGTLEARVEVTVSPKMSSRIEEILTDQGNRVSQGELLVRLDDEELRQQVAIAQANLEAAQAAVIRVRTEKQRATAVAVQAKRSYARAEALVGKNAISQEESDKATEALAVANAGLSSAEAAIAEAQKELIAAEKTWEYQRARLQDTRINAPFDGLIVQRHCDPGDIVVPGSAILTLISTDELWISAWVDETEMGKLEVGRPAKVVFRSDPERSFSGTVTRLGREADRETREFIVDVRVLELPENWAVGQRAEVYIETSKKTDVTLVPPEFVVREEGVPGVFMEADGRARWRPVTLGLRSRNALEVIEGLKPGETVVKPVDPRTNISDGRWIETL
ncbi:MAG: efflux RND transporter periplasmic adaptor subunit [Planctomycetota bacterium]|nr:MAG: efflux RND transporter periplasmic adaptor subunit [Planctomycetota bacterium]